MDNNEVNFKIIKLLLTPEPTLEELQERINSLSDVDKRRLREGSKRIWKEVEKHIIKDSLEDAIKDAS